MKKNLFLALFLVSSTLLLAQETPGDFGEYDPAPAPIDNYLNLAIITIVLFCYYKFYFKNKLSSRE